MNKSGINHVQSRDWLISELKKEVIGPEPFGEEVDTSIPLSLAKEELITKMNRQCQIEKDDLEEMLSKSWTEEENNRIIDLNQ